MTTLQKMFLGPEKRTAWQIALVLSAAVMIGLVGLGTRLLSGEPIAQNSKLASVDGGRSALRLEGVASCTASSCHGGNDTRAIKGSEYTIWITDDPHAKAFSVLYTDRSKRIERNLRKLRNLADAKPEADSLCLSCHVQPRLEASPHGSRFSLDDGVGCESCHGPAEKWRAVHFLPEWQSKSPQQKAELGMRNTKDLTVRAKLCLDCHIGFPEASVNHDLIAAGHPRLNFELGSYLANLPKHWRDKDDKARYPDLESRAWLMGQILSAERSIDLLEFRAKTPQQPWPEFAEYDCFACHHELAEPSWRQQRGYAKGKPGALTWNSWYTLMPRRMADQAENSDAIRASFDQLEQEMNKAYPNRARISELSRQSGERLQVWFARVEQKQTDPAAVRQWLKSIATEGQTRPPQNWDEAAQLYAALAALDQALVDMDSSYRQSSLREPLRGLAQRLEFPKGYDSPKPFRPGVIAEDIRKIMETLGR